MSTYAWATPSKAFEYYLDAAGRTPEDLWNAVYDGHVRVSVMDEEFAAPQVRALLNLLHWNVPEHERKFELPIWMAVNVDDVERALCGQKLPIKRRGRPRKSRDQNNREYRLAVEVSKLMGNGIAASVAEAARILVEGGHVEGHSYDAKLKRVQRAYSTFFRHD